MVPGGAAISRAVSGGLKGIVPESILMTGLGETARAVSGGLMTLLNPNPGVPHSAGSDRCLESRCTDVVKGGGWTWATLTIGITVSELCATLTIGWAWATLNIVIDCSVCITGSELCVESIRRACDGGAAARE